MSRCEHVILFYSNDNKFKYSYGRYDCRFQAPSHPKDTVIHTYIATVYWFQMI